MHQLCTLSLSLYIYPPQPCSTIRNFVHHINTIQQVHKNVVPSKLPPDNTTVARCKTWQVLKYMYPGQQSGQVTEDTWQSLKNAGFEFIYVLISHLNYIGDNMKGCLITWDVHENHLYQYVVNAKDTVFIATPAVFKTSGASMQVCIWIYSGCQHHWK